MPYPMWSDTASETGAGSHQAAVRHSLYIELFLILLNNICSYNRDHVYVSSLFCLSLMCRHRQLWTYGHFRKPRTPSVLSCSPVSHGGILALPTHPCLYLLFISPDSCTELLAEMSRQLGYISTWYCQVVYRKAVPCIASLRDMRYPVPCPPTPSLPKLL